MPTKGPFFVLLCSLDRSIKTVLKFAVKFLDFQRIDVTKYLTLRQFLSRKAVKPLTEQAFQTSRPHKFCSGKAVTVKRTKQAFQAAYSVGRGILIVFFFRKSMKFLSSEGKDSLKLQLHFPFLKKLDDVIVTLSSLSILSDSTSQRCGFLKYAEDVAFLAEDFEALGTSQDLETVRNISQRVSLREGKTTENLISLNKHIHLGNCSSTSYFIPKRGQSQI